MRYKSLMDAVKILHKLQTEIDKDDGSLITPHWRLINHAKQHLSKQADNELRSLASGDEEKYLESDPYEGFDRYPF